MQSNGQITWAPCAVERDVAVAEDRFEPRPGRVRLLKKNYFKLEMWANAQPDGRPAAKFG